jgi:hypothetical protein
MGFRERRESRQVREEERVLGAGRERQISSGTILIAPEGHSATHMPQPLQ